MGEGTQTRPGPQLTAAHGDPGLQEPAACTTGADAATACTAAVAGAPSAQAAVVAAGDPATTTAARIGISFRSIFPPVVMIASVSPAMLAPAVPANGKTTLSKSDGLPGVG
ncbi:hypothetical protein AB0J63_33670 [Streptosporangium canum]|uniref:hypothetical protein n=1 Tax=Streptosporangium canum TaxID=324952 RepID=UPI0034357AAE